MEVISSLMHFSLLFVICGFLVTRVNANYEPTWKSLDSRPLPSWYEEAKIGIFLHWGVYSVPSYGSEWFWSNWKGGAPKYVEFMNKNYKPGFTYHDFGPQFTAENYDPDEWAKLFAASGAKYVVLTSKHHEGFTMWPSKHSWGWNAVDVGPHRDLLGDLAKSIKNEAPQIHFGLYYSLYEWFHPLYLEDKQNEFKTQKYVHQKALPELYEIVNNYHPEVVWTDGDWEPYDTYWNATDFIAWLFNESPVKDTVIVNDRWGSGNLCQHGSFYTCADRYNPGVLQPHKWENCMSLDKRSWGYRANAYLSDYLTITELLKTMAETVSCGGNLLVNAGPTHDGMIPTIMEERLRQMGQWLTINGEAIYNSRPWEHQNDTYTSDVWYTQNADKSATFAMVINWPENSNLTLGSVSTTKQSNIKMFGYPKMLLFKSTANGTEIIFPDQSQVMNDWVFVLRMTNIRSN